MSPTGAKGKRSSSTERWDDDDSSRERRGGENGRNSRSSSRVKKDFSDKDILDIKVVRIYVRTECCILTFFFVPYTTHTHALMCSHTLFSSFTPALHTSSSFTLFLYTLPFHSSLPLSQLAELKSVFDRFAVDSCITAPETVQALTEAGIVAPRR